MRAKPHLSLHAQHLALCPAHYICNNHLLSTYGAFTRGQGGNDLVPFPVLMELQSGGWVHCISENTLRTELQGLWELEDSLASLYTDEETETQGWLPYWKAEDWGLEISFTI